MNPSLRSATADDQVSGIREAVCYLIREQAPRPPPRVQIDEAARRTVEALAAPSGVLEIVEG